MSKNRTKNLDVDIIPDTLSYDEETGIFECYGNVKNVIDSDGERTLDGFLVDSIALHKTKGTRPLMLFMHKRDKLPVGTWLDFKEDDEGLWMQGRLSKTTMGTDLEVLAKDGAITKFSIGMMILLERYNSDDNCIDIIKAHVKEVSWVNFAANDMSELVSIKSALDGNELPSKRDLQNLLRANGLSKRQAEKIANNYNPQKHEVTDGFDLIAKAL